MSFISQAKAIDREEALSYQGFRVYYEMISVQTDRENLTSLDPRLSDHIKLNDFFYIHDLTCQLQMFVRENRINDGTLTAQILHTSATLIVN